MYDNLDKEALLELLKEKDAQLQAKEQLLLRQDRVTLLGEGIEDLTDQWKKPLIAISASANKMHIKSILGLMSDEVFQHELDNIISNSEFLSQSVSDLAGFCSEEKIAKVFEVEKLLQRVLSISNAMLQGKEIDILLQCDECYAKGYENELMQALLNIINNAADELMKKNKERFIHIRVVDSNQFVTIEIEDNAEGIDEALLDKIFDKYFTTKGEEGLGTGLFVTKKIIQERFDGSINVSNGIHGAIFTIKLPLYQFLDLEELDDANE